MTEDVDRQFEGRAVLDALLASAGSVADTEDVAQAFAAAINAGVPASVVIDALWEDEPRFATPRDAGRLFGNLLGLFDAIQAGTAIDLSGPQAPRGRERAPRPEPLGERTPDEAFVEAASRYLFDHPRERERLAHVFDSRHDELVSWLDGKGLSDEAFGLARTLVGDIFALLELGGRPPARVSVAALESRQDGELPAALGTVIDDGVFEAENDEDAPLPAEQAAAVKALVTRAATVMWGTLT